MSDLKTRILKAAEYELDDHGSEWAKGIANEHQRLRPLVEALAQAVDALENVKAKDGMCIFGTWDLADTPDQAFRQGSAYAYSEGAGIARDALANLERVVGK